MLVVDASIAVRWFVVEPGDQEALALLKNDELLIAPELLVAEVLNAIWKRMVRKQLDVLQAAAAARELPKMLAEFAPIAPLAARTFEIAAALSHPIYDCFYLALAEARSAAFVTADRRLLARVAGTAWEERVRGLGH